MTDSNLFLEMIFLYHSHPNSYNKNHEFCEIMTHESLKLIKKYDSRTVMRDVSHFLIY